MSLEGMIVHRQYANLALAGLALTLGCPEHQINEVRRLLGNEVIADSPEDIVHQVRRAIKEVMK